MSRGRSCASPTRAPATPCTRNSTTRASSKRSRRSGCPCSRSRAPPPTGSITSCAPTSAAASPATRSRALRADIAVVLIGERPGLSAPDSMGAYLTFKPTPQTTDAERNCISNIRPEGLAYADAAVTLVHLLRAIRARQISGVRLKDDRLLLDGG